MFWNCSEEKIKQLKGGRARNRDTTVARIRASRVPHTFLSSGNRELESADPPISLLSGLPLKTWQMAPLWWAAGRHEREGRKSPAPTGQVARGSTLRRARVREAIAQPALARHLGAQRPKPSFAVGPGERADPPLHTPNTYTNIQAHIVFNMSGRRSKSVVVINTAEDPRSLMVERGSGCCNTRRVGSRAGLVFYNSPIF